MVSIFLSCARRKEFSLCGEERRAKSDFYLAGFTTYLIASVLDLGQRLIAIREHSKKSFSFPQINAPSIHFVFLFKFGIRQANLSVHDTNWEQKQRVLGSCGAM